MKKSDLEINPKPSKFESSDNDQAQEAIGGVDPKAMKNRLYAMYPLGLVPRSDIHRATGGILQRNTMSNMDSRGEGISDKLLVGNKRCYTVDAIVEFVMGRVKTAA